MQCDFTCVPELGGLEILLCVGPVWRSQWSRAVVESRWAVVEGQWCGAGCQGSGAVVESRWAVVEGQWCGAGCQGSGAVVESRWAVVEGQWCGAESQWAGCESRWALGLPAVCGRARALGLLKN